MVEYTLGKREQIAICEEDTWAALGAKTMVANGYIPGKNVKLEPDFSNNWTEVLSAGANSRDVQSYQKGALSYNFKLSFIVTDWRFLRYCAHGTVSNTDNTTYYTHTFTKTDAVKSFTTEWARRGSTNHVITLTGCIIKSLSLDFQKGNGADSFIIANCECLAKSATATGTSITTVSANSGTPFHFRMAKLTLNASEIVEVNSGTLTIDNGINEEDSRYCNSTLDQAIGEPIPTVSRYTCKFNINMKDGSFYTLFNNQVVVPGASSLVFTRGTNDDCTFTLTSLYLDSPSDPTNIEGINNLDLVGKMLSLSIVAKDGLNTY
jgi:hypothetical protein